MISAFSDLHSFWHMGGYAGPVWSAYGIVLSVLCIQLLLAQRKWRSLRKLSRQKYIGKCSRG